MVAERGFRGLRLVWVTILALLLNYLIFRHVLISYFTGSDSFYALVDWGRMKSCLVMGYFICGTRCVKDRILSWPPL